MKTRFIIIGVILLLVIGFFVVGTGGERVSGGEIMMYKSPNCGCCVGHASYLSSKGFEVKVVSDDVSMQAVKNQNGIPLGMRSCHTTFIDGYFVEGHVPIEAINKLLSEKPDIDGIALPNMPSGSPGMPGVKKGDWVIYVVNNGQTSEFMRI
jgi:hypothetical protein